MSRAIFFVILGAIVLALGIWWWTVVGPSFAFLGPIVVQGLGGAFIVTGWAIMMDIHAPTSRKL